MTQFQQLEHMLRIVVYQNDCVLNMLATVLRKENQIMALIDDLIADVEDESSVVASIVTLLENIKAQLDAAGLDPAKLQALKNSIDAQKQKMADAIVANTPAGP